MEDAELIGDKNEDSKKRIVIECNSNLPDRVVWAGAPPAWLYIFFVDV
jgi:hypothetical protein